MADGDYLTQAQLKARFDSERELSYLTGDEATGVVDEEDLDSAIEYAEGQINIALAMRYETPVVSTETSVTEYLRRLAGDLAEYHMRSRKPPVDDTIQTKYDLALATLDQFARGERALPGAVTPETAQSRGDTLTYSSQTDNDASKRSFSRTKTARL